MFYLFVALIWYSVVVTSLLPKDAQSATENFAKNGLPFSVMMTSGIPFGIVQSSSITFETIGAAIRVAGIEE